ncbi:MAG: S-adenosyl-L-homocysteine hydrolase [Novosphingobium sp.]|uniref:S-adenosyl-L-homocysteine hydrolase n=1 Tax=Novosphingobium sp. TaxID=1874826 RepID=UPI0026193CB2|nr:S-adenosyl-L-homocysteine hydrolase [Novosphingobium sp.]MCP5386749.1 S-adenosyl-L-homocysteine hydrolase [Novosphingobium sp.]
MGIVNRVAASLAASALVVSLPASAAGYANGGSNAEKLRRLNIMLMVTGLRCRTTADNFQADYGRFTTAHVGELNVAASQLRAEYARRSGAAGADRALDRMSVSMANQYGQGHPWLNCAQLKMVARNLATAKGSAPLIAAADQLLDDKPMQLAIAGN